MPAGWARILLSLTRILFHFSGLLPAEIRLPAITYLVCSISVICPFMPHPPKILEFYFKRSLDLTDLGCCTFISTTAQHCLMCTWSNHSTSGPALHIFPMWLLLSLTLITSCLWNGHSCRRIKGRTNIYGMFSINQVLKQMICVIILFDYHISGKRWLQFKAQFRNFPISTQIFNVKVHPFSGTSHSKVL